MFSGADQVLGITAEGNSITLPAELFANSNDSGEDPGLCIAYSQEECIYASSPPPSLPPLPSPLVFVASFYFRNLSQLLPGRV